MLTCVRFLSDIRLCRGFSQQQTDAAIILQTHFRGRKARLRFKALVKGVDLMLNSEKYVRSRGFGVAFCWARLILISCCVGCVQAVYAPSG